MITSIKGEGFKGLTFNEKIGAHTLLIGPNGAGKSARSQALMLALNGYIPGSGKTNGDILQNYGDGDKLIVGATIGNVLFERGFVRKGDKVSQGFKVAGKGAKESEFNTALGTHGAPRAIDIGAFMALSDQKKIDFVFSLYPPEEDISCIIEKIEATKTKINALAAKEKSTNEAAARLTTSRATMQLPTGTLAETHFKIKDTEAKLTQARQDLKDAEIEEAKQKAEEEGRKKAEEEARLKAEAEAKRKADEEAKKKADEEARRKLLAEQAAKLKAEEAAKVKVEENPKTDTGSGAIGPTNPGDEVNKVEGPFNLPPIDGVYTAIYPGKGKLEDDLHAIENNYQASIRAILDALNSAGCSACAARLVAIRELRKYQNKEAV